MSDFDLNKGGKEGEVYIDIETKDSRSKVVLSYSKCSYPSITINEHTAQFAKPEIACLVAHLQKAHDMM